MPQDNQPQADSPAQWFRLAQGDLALARVKLPENIPTELLCFHAQQVVEKSIKAVLVHFRVPVPRTHNLEMLMDLAAASVKIPDFVQDAADLTPYASLARYPGNFELQSEDDYHNAIVKADCVLSWAKTICGSD